MKDVPVSEAGELVPWLRQRVRERMETARKACERTDGHWWRRTEPYGDGTSEPAGHLYAGERIADGDGGTWGGEFTVVYDEGAPSREQFEHMEANDPRDVIARCEAELALLDEHGPFDPESDWLRDFCATCGHLDRNRVAFPCRTVRLVGHGYRFRPGYSEAWRP